MLKIAVLVSGGGTNLQAIIDAIASGKITNTEISVVISNNPNAYALERAKKAGIQTEVLVPKTFENRDAFNKQLLQTIQSYSVGAIVLAGCLLTIPDILVQCYPEKIVNIHPSLIPAFCGEGYYGLKVHEAVLKRGCKVTGATVHFVDSGLDTGPIIMQKAVAVKEDDTPEKLQRRVMEEAEWELLPSAINLIANGKVKVVNDYVRIEE
ncbi:MAG: phosphoribosylglycinamide formyltransferase [Lachnospiraceae bacterium]|nr:phosphoribosylglycinamide formyltransferase [Lachnospiraceae bacterium]